MGAPIMNARRFFSRGGHTGIPLRTRLRIEALAEGQVRAGSKVPGVAGSLGVHSQGTSQTRCWEESSFPVQGAELEFERRSGLMTYHDVDHVPALSPGPIVNLSMPCAREPKVLTRRVCKRGYCATWGSRFMSSAPCRIIGFAHSNFCSATLGGEKKYAYESRGPQT